MLGKITLVLKGLFSSLFSTIAVIPHVLRRSLEAETFYAEALKLFYLKQLNLIREDYLYPSQIGGLNTLSLIYQNFASIYICYRVMNRRLFVLVSILLVLFSLISMGQTSGVSLVLSLVFLTSAINVFIVSERGNYQTLGLVVGAINSSLFLNNQISYDLFLITSVLVLFLSVSSFVLVAVLGLFEVGFNFSFLASLSLLAVSYLSSNLVLISLSSSTSLIQNIGKTYSGILSVLTFLGAYRKRSKNQVAVKRKISLFRGAASMSPYLFTGFFVESATTANLCFAASFVLFLNQSKLFRLFDFHLLYFFFYVAVLLSYSLSGQLNVMDFIVLFLLGTNPLILYGLNKSIAPDFLKATKFIEPAYVTREYLEALNMKLNEILSIAQGVIIFDEISTAKDGLEKVTQYDDIFGDKSLALEFFWEVLAMKNIAYFPDWYSLFYSDRGFEFYNLVSCGDAAYPDGWLGLYFDEHSVYQYADDYELINTFDLYNSFGEEVCNGYFPSYRYLHLVKL